MIQGPLVAGSEPVATEGCVRGRRVGFVPIHHVGSTHGYFANGADRKEITMLAKDRDLNTRADPDRPRTPPTGRHRVGGHLVRSLGHAVCLKHWYVEQDFEFAHKLRRKLGAA